MVLYDAAVEFLLSPWRISTPVHNPCTRLLVLLGLFNLWAFIAQTRRQGQAPFSALAVVEERECVSVLQLLSLILLNLVTLLPASKGAIQ